MRPYVWSSRTGWNVIFIREYRGRDDVYAALSSRERARSCVWVYVQRALPVCSYLTHPVLNTCPIPLIQYRRGWHLKRTSGSAAPLSVGVYANIARTRHPTNQSTLLSSSNAQNYYRATTAASTSAGSASVPLPSPIVGFHSYSVRPLSTGQGCKVRNFPRKFFCLPFSLGI